MCFKEICSRCPISARLHKWTHSFWTEPRLFTEAQTLCKQHFWREAEAKHCQGPSKPYSHPWRTSLQTGSPPLPTDLLYPSCSLASTDITYGVEFNNTTAIHHCMHSVGIENHNSLWMVRVRTVTFPVSLKGKGFFFKNSLLACLARAARPAGPVPGPVRVGRHAASGLRSIKQSHQESLNCDLHSALPMNPQKRSLLFHSGQRKRGRKDTEREGEKKKTERWRWISVILMKVGITLCRPGFYLFIYLFLYFGQYFHLEGSSSD